MKKLQQVKAWNWLMEQVSKMPDHNLRLAATQEFRERAMREWGWCPGNDGVQETPTKLEDFDGWEREFFEELNALINYDIDVSKDKRKANLVEARQHMLQFIKEGDTLLDIPDDIRTDTIVELFYEIKNALDSDLDAQIENVKNTPVHALYLKSGITIPKTE